MNAITGAAPRLVWRPDRTADLPSCVPGLVRAAMQRCAAKGHAFTLSRPDFAGQLHITVHPPNAASYTWAIVGNADEQYVSYLTFVEGLQYGPPGRRIPTMQR